MKKGFTLIELLAVIVILAIIAVIATPIVLNIINDTKQSAILRSADFYLEGVETAIATSVLKGITINDGTYNITKDGNLCIGTLSNNECVGEVIKVEMDGGNPKGGYINIASGDISFANIIFKEKTIQKNSKGEFVYAKYLDEVCKHISGTPRTAGAKYECKVDPNQPIYTFYVLTTPQEEDSSINLIMDQNINSDGTPAGMVGVSQSQNSSKYNLLPWISVSDYGTLFPYDGNICWGENGCQLNDKGPVTIMDFLQEATKNWTNTNEMMIHEFVYENGVIEKMKSYNMHARIPIYLKNSEKTEVSDKTDDNAYLYDNLDPQGANPPYGYWTLSAQANWSPGVWYVNCGGSIYGISAGYIARYGVRPVINLSL